MPPFAPPSPTATQLWGSIEISPTQPFDAAGAAAAPGSAQPVVEPAVEISQTQPFDADGVAAALVAVRRGVEPDPTESQLEDMALLEAVKDLEKAEAEKEQRERWDMDREDTRTRCVRLGLARKRPRSDSDDELLFAVQQWEATDDKLKL